MKNSMCFPIHRIVVAILVVQTSAHCEEFGGIDFPKGALSFADVMISYSPNFSGGPEPTHPEFIDPAKALGVPDYSSGIGAVSLGSGGRIVLEFINNKLTGSDSPEPDLYIFEVGPDVEDTFVEISNDGANWHSVGKVSGAISSIDIDAFGFGSSDEFGFVRLMDDPNENRTGGPSAGADIDAVGAISTVPTPHSPPLEIERGILILVQFETLTGSRYTIQKSNDLLQWADEVVDIDGDGTVKGFFFEITAPKRFYRLKPPED